MLTWTASQAVLAMALAAGAGAAEAETATEASAVAEVVVTAQKRAEKLIDVPIAVTAFGEAQLEARGATKFTDIATSVPNMVFEQASDIRNQRISIRGISADTRFPGAESSVGVIVDDVYLAGVGGVAYDLADIEQIEVLRGPQGTLFGRNTTAGVINIRTHAPGETFEAKGVVEYGNYDHVLARGTISGPLVAGQLSASLGVLYANRDGYELATQTGEDMNTRDTFGVRGQLLWTPADDWSVRLIAEHTVDDYVPQGADLPPYDRRHPEVAFAPEARRVIDGGSLHIHKTFGSGLVFKSITGYREYETKERGDNDGQALTGRTLLDRGNHETSKETTQEFQLVSPGGGRTDWILGAFYMDQDLINRGAYDVDLDGFWDVLVRPAFPGNPSLRDAVTAFGGAANCMAPAPLCVGIAPARVTWSFDTETVALFGQFGFQATPRLKIEAGLRYSSETKEFTYDSTEEAAWPFPVGVPLRTVFIAGPQTPGMTALPIRDKIDQSVVTPKLSLTWKLDEGNNLYATAARGYKSGSFYANVIGVSDANSNGINDYLELLKIGKELSWNYEVGAKGRIGRVRYALDAYYVDYQGLQTQAQLLIATGAFNALTNADAELYGFEGELTAVLTEDLSFRAAVGYNHSKFTDYPNCFIQPANPGTGQPAAVQACDGNELIYAPNWTGSAGLDYSREFGNGLRGFATVEASYRSSQYFDATNLLRAGSMVLLDASLGVSGSDGRWTATIWGRNLTDEKYPSFMMPSTGPEPFKFWAAPRTYGVRLSFAY